MLDIVTDLEHIFTNDINIGELPKVSLYAIGGFPIKVNNDTVYLLDSVITKDTIKTHITKALGLSGIMTYSNKSNFSLEQMGNKCKSLNHYWGYNFITLSFLFANLDEKVELSFLRNNTFFESWVIGNKNVFGMTGTIKDFKKFISNKDDKSFDLPTREIMEYINRIATYLSKQQKQPIYKNFYN